MENGFALTGIAFWAFLAVSAVAGIVADYKKRHMELEPLRAAIERGQQLDPAIIERLMRREQHNSDPNPLHFWIGGIVTVAAGVGVGLLSLFIGQIAEKAFYPILGVGVVSVCVGIGLLITARVIDRHIKSRAAQERGA